MSYIFIAISSYFLTAWAVILDKFLLTGKKVSHPAVYAFYSGMLSFLTLFIFAPFGFHWIKPPMALASFLGGAIFLFGLLFLFYALEKGEASRVTPVVGATIPIVSFFLGLFFLGEDLKLSQILGVILLIAGGMAISFDFFKKTGLKLFSEFKHSILAGVFFAVSYAIFKKLYAEDNFVNVFIWTRMGLFIGALGLLVYSGYRENILNSFQNFKKSKKENSKSGGLFIFNKILGGSGSVIFNYAVSLGSVTIVNALVATEYVFVFLIGLALSFWFSSVFQENKNWRIIFQKIVAIIVIGAGIGMIMG